jgi:TonB family protein
MSSALPAARGPLWAQLDQDDDRALPLWKAAAIAFALELSAPLLLFGVDWSFLPHFDDAPIPVMSVRLDEPPQLEEPPPPPPEEKPKPRKRLELKHPVPIELPKRLPDQAESKIELPKPAPKPAPKPEVEKPPEPQPQPQPELEAPPLPSVFRDVKPVRKVKPIYPPEAEAQHIQGRVKVRLSVDLEGNVTDVELLFSEPPGVFDEAVLTAVKQYKFKKDGTTYQADQEIVFKIDE